MVGSFGMEDNYVGDEVQGMRDMFICLYLIEYGIVNWDVMEKIWYYIFYNKFCVVLEGYFVFLIEFLFNFKVNRENV